MIFADLGALHANYPTHNAQTVLELMQHNHCQRVLLLGLTHEQWSSHAWKNLESPVLFALHDAKISVEAIAPDWTWSEAEHAQMLDFLKQFPQGRRRLQEFAQAKTDLRTAFQVLPDTEAVYDTKPEGLLAQVRNFHARAQEILEEGPGTAHRKARIQKILETLKNIDLKNTDLKNTALLVPIDDMPEFLDAGFKLPNTKNFAAAEASRFRALIDRAYRLEEDDDLNALVHNLLALDGPPDSVLGRMALEARFAASGLYLATADLESATDLLQAVAGAQFDRPAYLPGLVLARLAQVHDLAGRREKAVRVYRAALMLQWLPQEARQACERGLEEAFGFEDSSVRPIAGS